jgi:hypothetical protein
VIENQAKPKTPTELLAEAVAKRANAEKTRIAAHNEAFATAYLKAIETSDESVSFVVVEIPKVGKTLHRFGDGPKHAEFKRHANAPNKPLEMGPCKTYSCHTAVWPEPLKFKELCEKYNVQGFETSAMAVLMAMRPKDAAEGESSATEA